MNKQLNDTINKILEKLDARTAKTDGGLKWQLRPEDEQWVHRMAAKMRDLADMLDQNGVSFWHRMGYEKTMKDVLRKLNDIYDRGKQ